MLKAAWKRVTGEDLMETQEQLGRRAVMEIEFDLEEPRSRLAWPKVRIKFVKQQATA